MYDEMDSQDCESQQSEDESNDAEIPTEGEESAKDDDAKCRTETKKYEDSHTNDTTPSLDHPIDDSETETASENGQINDNNNDSCTAAEDNCEHSPSEDEQNTDEKTDDEYEDEYLDEDESDEKDVDQTNTSVKDTTLHDINYNRGQNTIRPYEDNDIDVKDVSDEQNADQMNSDDHKAKINEAATCPEQNTDEDISVDVSQHDHSYSKISAPKNNEEFRRVESPSGQKVHEIDDNEMSEAQVPH